MRKALLTTFLILTAVTGFGQYTQQDNASTKRQFRGMIEALQGFRLPIQGGHSIPAGDSLWFVRVNPGDGQIYMYNGLTWSCMTCGGAGIVDSSVFVTVTRLRDSLLRVQQTLNDSSAALRLAIADGSADSSVLATLYRLDTTRLGLDSRIAAKQNQLNGIGLVRMAGTTVSYDNTNYTPEARTITINGIAQDLSANRSWTISSSADSSIFATKYGVDTAKAALRSSINSKQNNVTLTTTGTSGAATFNQSTGALNIPNYANTTYTGSTSIILSSGSFQRAALTGDVTATQNSNSTTISNSAVTNAKMANMATQTFKGRNTAGSGAPEDLSVSTVRSMLSINNVDNTSDANKPISNATQAALNGKIDSVKTSVDSVFVKYNSTWYFAGIISAQGAGVSWGSISGTLSDQTDLQNALNAKLNIGDSTIYFSVSRALDSLSDHWSAIEGKLSSSDGRIANWTTAYDDKVNSAAFSGTTTKTLTLTQQDGGTVTASFTDDNTTYTGSTSISLTGGSFQRAALTGDVTASANSNATTIANNAVTNAKAADMAVNTIKGRITAGTGDPEDLTASQVRTIINVADGAEVNVNADWNASSGDAQILNKPTIPDISGLATQQALDDSMDIVRDSINALRADIGSGGGGLDTATVSSIIADSLSGVIRQGGNSFGAAVAIGSNDNQNVELKRNGSTIASATNNGFGVFGLSTSAGDAFYIDNSSVRLHTFYNTGRIGFGGINSVAGVATYRFYGLSNEPVADFRASINSGNSITTWTRNSGQVALEAGIGGALHTGSAFFNRSLINGKKPYPLTLGMDSTYVLTIDTSDAISFPQMTGADTSLLAIDENGYLLRKGINSLPFLSLADTTGKWLSANTVVTNWSGASTGINAATGRTSLGGTTVGQSIFTLTNPSAISFIRVNANNTVTARSVSDTRTDLGGTTVGQSFFTLTNPSAITFPRINANNTVSALSASDFRTAIGAGTGNGTVTSVGVSVPTGFSVSGSPVTSSGTIAITYAAGYQGYTSTEASKLSNIEANADVTDATNVSDAGAIMDGDFSANGVMIRTASGSYTSRTITGTTNQITVTNGDGVSGNPTLSLPNAVTDNLSKAATALQLSDTTVIATKHYVDSSLNTPALVSINNQSGSSYTLTSNDFNGKTVVVATNSGSITIEVPPSMPVGSSVLIEQGAAGQITFTPGSGVTLHSFESALTTKGTNATVTIYCKAADTYTLSGNLE